MDHALARRFLSSCLAGGPEAFPSSRPPLFPLQDYGRKYQSRDAAHGYARKYRTSLKRIWRSWRERTILARLLDSQPRCNLLLDCPSGGGRLSRVLWERCERLIEADFSRAQLLVNQRENGLDPRVTWITASAFSLPLPDASVDATVCIRLAHHLHTPEEREALLRELLRISRRFVIVSFSDTLSVKNFLRRLGSGRPPKGNCAPLREIAAMAEAAGARLVAAPSSSLFGSNHRFALIEKKLGE